MRINTQYHARKTHAGKPEKRRATKSKAWRYDDDRQAPTVGGSLVALEARLAAIGNKRL